MYLCLNKWSMDDEDRKSKKKVIVIISVFIIVSFLIGVFGNTLYMTFGV